MNTRSELQDTKEITAEDSTSHFTFIEAYVFLLWFPFQFSWLFGSRKLHVMQRSIYLEETPHHSILYDYTLQQQKKIQL